jgi:hypothetical protein
MSERLQELLQHRANLQSHLAWLDREIVAARASNPVPCEPSPIALPGQLAPASTRPAQVNVVATTTASVAPTSVDAQADEILAQYRQDTPSLQADLRKGCLLYFFGALALLGLGIVAFYFLNRLIQSSAS